MTKRLPAILLAVAATVALSAFSASSSAREQKKNSAQGGPTTTPADVRRILSALADDSMEGRASGTRGAQRAARYIGGEMKKIGLEPLGDSGYFQRVDMSNNAQVPPAIRSRPAVNVLGVISGSDPALKNEYVLVDAHYDH